MHINNFDKIKPVNKESLIYSLVFVLYAAVLILTFIYFVKFLNNNINLALSTPASEDMENKYGQLDLEDYSLVASKLNLTKPVIIKPVITNTVTSTINISPVILENNASSSIINTPIATTTRIVPPQINKPK